MQSFKEIFCAKFSMPEEMIARVVARVGRTDPVDRLEASKTAFVVIDMQNYYLKPGYLGDVPLARGIVPAIMRSAGRGADFFWAAPLYGMRACLTDDAPAGSLGAGL
jgi:hypothetical protein